jgi:hypothetical protein
VKKLLLLLTFIFSSWASAQDCYYCLSSNWWLAPKVPEWPIEYVNIQKIDYQRNDHGTYCRRPEDIVDTIVLHHSETASTATPEILNDYHLSRGPSNDPWLMIGYTYVINSPYEGSSVPTPRVTEGRPLDIVGAHAGSNAFISMDADQQKMWDEGKITCGNERIGFKVDPTLIKDGKIKANVTTIGLVITGNYSPFSKTNPNGYPKNNPRHPTEATLDLTARTACQLQKKYPRMKNIKWHNLYNATTCPGTIQSYVGQIKALTRKYGCEFN